MKYLLDTNVCVDYLTGRFPNVVQRLQQASPKDLRLSPIVVAELRFGAEKSRQPEANHGRIDILEEEIACLDFDARAAATFGRVRAKLESQGTPIGPYDTLIAAHALSAALVLVSDNLSEFERVEGLRVESWR